MEDYVQEIQIAGDEFEYKDQFADVDPFMKSWEDLKVLNDLDSNFKRRNTRLEKAYDVPRNVDGSVNTSYAEAAGMRATGQNGSQTKQMNPGEVFRNGYGVFDVITPPYNLYELANYYDTNFANHAAIDAIVSNVVGQGYYFDPTQDTQMMIEDMSNESAQGKAKRRIDRMKAQLEVWLEECNDEESFTSTLEKVYTDYRSTGNGYLEIGRTTSGDIGYIGHIPSTTMRVRRLRDGFVQIIAGKAVYFRNFQATNPNPITNDPRPNEVIHIKDYSPLNTYYGVPDIISAIESLVGDQMASQYNIDYFQNKAVPRYVFITKGAKLGSDSQDRLFRFMQTGLKGQNHRTLYIPLPPDQEGNKVEFDMKPIENGVQEASFEKYRTQNRDNILMAHQTPLSKLGAGDGAIASALADDRTFKEQVSRPAQKNLQKTINKIIREKTDVIEFKLNELTLTDEVAMSQVYERYVKTQVMVPNEVREKLGLPQRVGGDDPFELSSRQGADTRSDMASDDARSQDRAANASDSTSTTTGRNPQGEGRASQ